jgi:hypothetical protein
MIVLSSGISLLVAVSDIRPGFETDHQIEKAGTTEAFYLNVEVIYLS